MASLSWNEIQNRAAEFVSKYKGETYEKGESQSFWSDFLNIYGVDRRRHGAFFEYAVKKLSGKQGFIDMFWPGKLLAEQKSGGKDLAKANVQAFEYLDTMPDHDLPQGIVVSDFTSFEFIDLNSRQKTNFSLKDLPKHVKLFGFLINETSQQTAEEDPVNVKAAEAMAKLHNQLKDDNYTGHDLELLLVRLVFCMFADDSGIFEHGQLKDYVQNRTQEDGSDLGSRLADIFQTLNKPKEFRQHSLDEDLKSLEYINGGLFEEAIQTPHFTAQMRHDLLKAMELDWSKVSPAIFGSMFQGVMDKEQRRNLGAHYTSEKNILRVIKPLFLDELYQEFGQIKYSPKKLKDFHEKLAELKFLDPACGCGNFLVITYRELRELEHKVVAQLEGKNKQDMFASGDSGVGKLKVNVNQMYGIEIEEFPSLIAQTALWLTDHQMNIKFSQQSGKTFRRLPLKTSATIVHANALTTDWAEVIAPRELDFILGNPPFLGKSYQTKEQKEDLASLLGKVKGAGVLDFVTGWYIKAAYYMKQNPKIQTALVSTNSIIQGEQVPILWKYLFEQGVAINFLHQTFKWSNDAKGNAAVYCTIVGFALFNKPEKRIFEYEDIRSEPNEIQAKNINGYGVDASSVNIQKRQKPLSDVPEMSYGSMPNDGGNLLLSQEEKDELLQYESEAGKWVRKFVMGNELINNIPRYCLWLQDISPNELRNLPHVSQRVQKVRQMRESSTRATTRELATTPTLFGELRQPQENYLALPRVSSENRAYIPMTFLGNEVIAGDKVYTISGATRYHFGILTSQMHMAWMRTTAGRLKSDYSYTNSLVYNNFIWPEVTTEQEREVERLAQAVLDARAEFPGASLADLYDPLTMPPELSRAHRTLDKFIDRLYRKEGFTSDPERIAHLFELYQQRVVK